ncbi:MAG: hypothetical protein K1X71_10520 [Pirellulales bacterium]|nr:hypothetical protein [Pirellulales bacterium]
MTQILHGVVHGRTIELDAAPSALDGKQVRVILIGADPSASPGEGILRSAGALEDVVDIDQYIAEMAALRKRDRRKQEPVA